jgi:hypothetical protein
MTSDMRLTLTDSDGTVLDALELSEQDFTRGACRVTVYENGSLE